MAKSKFTTEEQIKILHEAENPKTTITAVCKQHNISMHTYYQWKKKHLERELAQTKYIRSAEMTASNKDQERIYQLQEEIRRLERLVARQALIINQDINY